MDIIANERKTKRYTIEITISQNGWSVADNAHILI